LRAEDWKAKAKAEAKVKAEAEAKAKAKAKANQLAASKASKGSKLKSTTPKQSATVAVLPKVCLSEFLLSQNLLIIIHKIR
jgi:hypothetical protein